MNQNQKSDEVNQDVIPFKQIIQKRNRRRGGKANKIKMDNYDLRNLLNNEAKGNSTSLKRSREDDSTTTKKLKTNHEYKVKVNTKLNQTTSNNNHRNLSPKKNLKLSSQDQKFNQTNCSKSPKLNQLSSNIGRTSSQKSNRRYSSPKKNIAAQRLENLRKSFPTALLTSVNTSSSTNSIAVKSFANERLNSSQGSPGLNRSFANDRLSGLKNRLSVQSSENKEVPSTSTESMEHFEEMEWEQLPDEYIIKDIVEIRNSIQENPNIFNGIESSFCFFPDNNIEMLFNKATVQKSKFIIIIDTNIFLSNLKVVKNLLNCNCYDNDLKIVIPWMVFQELDFFKTQSSKLSKNAQTAVRFINGELAAKNPKLKGQTAFEATENVIPCQGPDDRILDCSLQYKSDNNITIILSNDINLRNKALVNNIEAYSSEEILKTIESKMENINRILITVPKVDKDLENKFRQFHKVLSSFLNTIIEKEMHNAYGDIWKTMVQFKTTSTIPTLINCILKYWKAIFNFVYPKHMRTCITQLLQSFDDCELNEMDLRSLIETTLSLCLHLQNVSEEYFQIILPIIKELKTILL